MINLERKEINKKIENLAGADRVKRGRKFPNGPELGCQHQMVMLNLI